MEEKAQGSVDYLLMLGVALIVTAIGVIAVGGVIGDANKNTQEINTKQPLKDLLNLSTDPNATNSNLFKTNSDLKIKGITFQEQ
jgi:hypothetical protein